MLLLSLLLCWLSIGTTGALTDDDWGRLAANGADGADTLSISFIPCVESASCRGRIFGTNPKDISQFGNIPPCRFQGWVRCIEQNSNEKSWLQPTSQYYSYQAVTNRPETPDYLVVHNTPSDREYTPYQQQSSKVTQKPTEIPRWLTATRATRLDPSRSFQPNHLPQLQQHQQSVVGQSWPTQRVSSEFREQSFHQPARPTEAARFSQPNSQPSGQFQQQPWHRPQPQRVVQPPTQPWPGQHTVESRQQFAPVHNKFPSSEPPKSVQTFSQQSQQFRPSTQPVQPSRPVEQASQRSMDTLQSSIGFNGQSMMDSRHFNQPPPPLESQHLHQGKRPTQRLDESLEPSQQFHPGNFQSVSKKMEADQGIMDSGRFNQLNQQSMEPQRLVQSPTSEAQSRRVDQQPMEAQRFPPSGIQQPGQQIQPNQPPQIHQVTRQQIMKSQQQSDQFMNQVMEPQRFSQVESSEFARPPVEQQTRATIQVIQKEPVQLPTERQRTNPTTQRPEPRRLEENRVQQPPIEAGQFIEPAKSSLDRLFQFESMETQQQLAALIRSLALSASQPNNGQDERLTTNSNRSPVQPFESNVVPFIPFSDPLPLEPTSSSLF